MQKMGSDTECFHCKKKPDHTVIVNATHEDGGMTIYACDRHMSAVRQFFTNDPAAGTLIKAGES